MAVRTIDSRICIFDDPAEPLVDLSRRVSSLHPDGSPEIHLGAFRGLAFALIFEVVLVLLGGLAWQVLRTLL
ncbi:MAG: hypothetical protein ACLGXA_22070 [Acidobacteriota bacterium]